MIDELGMPSTPDTDPPLVELIQNSQQGECSPVIYAIMLTEPPQNHHCFHARVGLEEGMVFDLTF